MNVKPKKRELWLEEVRQELAGHSKLFVPLGEYLGVFFANSKKVWHERHRGEDMWRRPVVGIKLDINDKVLAFRPGWKPPKRYWSGDRENMPGELKTDQLIIELLGPGKELSLTIQGGIVSDWRLPTDTDKRHAKLKLVSDAAHHLLHDPMALFGGHADHCVNCRKTLSDDVSRTRGIGPECIKMFDCFLEKPPSGVEQYRLDYLSETGFLPGS